MAVDGSEKDNATPAGIVSGGFDVQVITIASNIGVGANQVCREVLVWPEAGKTVSIGGSVASAAGGAVLPAATPLRIPISNTSKLHFNGTDADKVYILWRT
jgi:hypothetical protein